ncbi:MAG: hypothetical protein ACE5DX_04020 [Candidatus Dojkabacteria bacterium]
MLADLRYEFERQEYENSSCPTRLIQVTIAKILNEIQHVNSKLKGISLLPIVAVIAIIIIAGGAVLLFSSNSNPGTGNDGDDTIQDLVGNQDLSEDDLPDDVVDSLNDINEIVSETEDCSTDLVRAMIPEGWQCRKLDTNPGDFTLYTDGNTLNLSIGTGQGKSSCDIFPGCTEKSVDLSGNFKDMLEYKQPTIESVEITGTYKDNGSVKVLVTSNDELTQTETDQITKILDSVEQI